MLTKKEKKVMESIFKIASGKKSILVSPQDIVRLVGEITISETEKIVSALSQDGYFDLVFTDRHGEMIFCIILSEKGKGFRRDEMHQKRNLVYRISLSVGLAFLSFLIGLVLKAIFT